MYVRTYVCTYVRMHVCMHVRMHACMHARMFVIIIIDNNDIVTIIIIIISIDIIIQGRGERLRRDFSEHGANDLFEVYYHML